MDDILLLGFLSCIGTHVVGPLPDFWASGNPVWLGNGIFWTNGHSCIGTHAVGPLQDSVHKIPDGPIYAGKTSILG